jgi:hypothetical protein
MGYFHNEKRSLFYWDIRLYFLYFALPHPHDFDTAFIPFGADELTITALFGTLFGTIVCL